jgi:hypothetical protein
MSENITITSNIFKIPDRKRANQFKKVYEFLCTLIIMSSNLNGEAFQKLMHNARKEINESMGHYNIKAKYELYAPAIQDNPEVTVMILRATKKSLGSGMLYNIVNTALLNYMPINFHLEAGTVDDDYKFTQDDSKG